jgi:hypothetical protein
MSEMSELDDANTAEHIYAAEVMRPDWSMRPDWLNGE